MSQRVLVKTTHKQNLLSTALACALAATAGRPHYGCLGHMPRVGLLVRFDKTPQSKSVRRSFLCCARDDS